MPRSPFRSAGVGVALALVLAACGGTTSTAIPSTCAASCGPATGSPSAPTAAVKLTVGLGYIPSVQFAPFYLAQQQGFYAAEGLAVTFQNAIDADLVPKVGSGQVDIGLSDGTSVIPAVSQGVPIRYVATVYGKFPSIVFAKASSGITSAADLKGKRIGIPGQYGSSWVMLQALLASASLRPADVTIVEYPDFGQGAALSQGAIDAATGFVNNEPVQLERSGTKASILAIDAITPLPGPGLIVGTTTAQAKGGAIAGFVRATLKAMNQIRATPSAGVDAAVAAESTLGQDRDLQAAILAATIAAWAPPGAAADAPLTGQIDTAGWQKSIDYLATLGLVANPVKIDDVVSSAFTAGS
ncbi:MAG TPA: ABC transporter substrate-binding protein [Candidatus Limnocylindrales bacterium]|nr:ABC transporter substrate-binding protein [Candidatus Limnocylindrales bacterium]